MLRALLLRFLARQFARPSGLAGRLLIAPWLDCISREMNRSALAALDLRGAENVLEVGFGGGGLLAQILRKTSGTVTAVDPSPAMVARARRRFRSHRLRVLVGTAESLPLQSASVDMACSINTLYFWDPPNRAMSELARVIRSGGRLVLCAQTEKSVRAWPGHVHGFRAYGRDEIAGLMEAAGFRHVRSTSGHGQGVGSFFCLSGERL